MKIKWLTLMARIAGEGYEAFSDNESLEDNPYAGKRGGFNDAKRKAWADGWLSANKDMNDEAKWQTYKGE